MTEPLSPQRHFGAAKPSALYAGPLPQEWDATAFLSLLLGNVQMGENSQPDCRYFHVLLRQKLSTEPSSFSDLNASNCDCLMSGMQYAETIMILSPEDVIKACTCWCFHGGPNRA